MKFLRLALAYLLAFAPVAEALTPMQRRVLAADQSPLANIEAFRSYVRSQKPTMFLDPDYVGSDRENLALQSEDFSNAAWNKTRSSISSNSIANPVDGATTADTLIEDATAANNHRTDVAGAINVVSGQAYNISVYAKIKERHISIRFDGAAFSGNPYAHFNLTTCAVNSTGSGVTASVESLANGWCRLIATMTATSTGAAYPGIYLATPPATVTYNGDGTSGAYIFGAQFQRASQNSSYTATTSIPVYGPSPSISSVGVAAAIGSLYGSVAAFTQSTDANKAVLSRPDRVENLLLSSGDFSDAAWSKTNVAFSAPTITANTGSAIHWLQQPITGVAGGVYRCIFDVEYGNYAFVDFGDSGDSVWHVQSTNLNTGTLGTATNISNASLSVISGKRYLISFEFTRTSAGNTRCAVGFGNGSTDTTIPSTSLAGTETFKVYSITLQRASMQPTYIATTTVPVYGSLTGRRMLTFDGSNDTMASTSLFSTIMTNAAGEFFIGYTPNLINAGQHLFQSRGGYMYYRIEASAGLTKYLNYDGTSDTAATTAIVAGANYVAYGRHDSGNIYVALNRSAEGTAASGNTSNVGTVLDLGSSDGTVNYFNGQLGPIITFNRVLPQPVRDTIRAGLQKFWRVP